MKSLRLPANFLFLITLITAQFPPELRPAAQNHADGAQSENLEAGRAEVEEAIKHLLVAQIEAWNHGDLEGFMNGYWHSPELTFFSGATVFKGWQATLERYKRKYQGAGREMGQLDFQDLNISLLSRQAAVVTGRWEVTLSDGKKPHGLFTLILKKVENGWHIVHDHTSSEERPAIAN
jgi:ketosteroid isomerase-like protein